MPEEVFGLLQKTIPFCPNLKYVVLEQLGVALTTLEQQEAFQIDFDKMSKIVGEAEKSGQTKWKGGG